MMASKRHRSSYVGIAGELRLAGRSAFTLFELILAIALSVMLVGLIATAINLYLTRVDASRTQVEEAQLARSILSMIADDIRATTVYQPQDTSALAAMASNNSSFDPDSIDDEGRSGGRGGQGETAGSPSGADSGESTGGAGMSSGLGSGTSTSGVSTMGGQTSEPESTLPLGLSGTLDELYVDATRLPRREELFATATGYTNAPIGVQTGAATGAAAAAAATAGMMRPSDLKSVRYFVRPGEPIDAGSIAATSLAPEAQLRAGGLVRQEIPRTMRVWAEQAGNSAVLDSGQALLAPEVVHIAFRYFDGSQVTDVWDMKLKRSLPIAVEVRLWIAPTGADTQAAALQYGTAAVIANAREYRQTVFLPMSQVSSSAATSGMPDMSSGSEMGSETDTGMSSSSGSSFGQP